MWGRIAPSPHFDLINDLGDDTGADRPAAFPDGEVAPNVESHRLVQADVNSVIIARHHHLDAVRQLHFAGDVRGPEVELRLVPAEKRRVPTAFVLAQDVNLTLEPLPWPDRARSGDHLTSLDLVALDASQQQADVLTSFALVQRLIERLNAGADTFENVTQAENFNLLTHIDDALLDFASCHRASALDGVNTLDGHEERLVDGPLRLWDVTIQSGQQFTDAIIEDRIGRVIQCALG